MTYRDTMGIPRINCGEKMYQLWGNQTIPFTVQLSQIYIQKHTIPTGKACILYEEVEWYVL